MILFRTTDETLFKKLGYKVNIRNGVGFGFISSPELYHKGYLEIGIGLVYSGYGDWGGGFDHTCDSAVKVVIDRDYNIISSRTESFYNNEDSKRVEKMASKLIKKLGKKFIVKNKLLKRVIDTIFTVIPCKQHVGQPIDFEDISHTDRMLQSILDEPDYYGGEYGHGFPIADAECKNTTEEKK